MQNAAAVGICHRVANVNKSSQKATKSHCSLADLPAPLSIFGMKLIASFSQAITPDESHCVKRAPVSVRTQSINGHNSGMFQIARNLRLAKESMPAIGVVGPIILNLLQ